MNILLVLPKICEIKVFNIMSPWYNKQINFPSPLAPHWIEGPLYEAVYRSLHVLGPCPPPTTHPPPIPPVHVLPPSLSLVICKCIHLHLRSLCIKADIKVQKRNCTVFCFSVDYTKLLFSTSLWTKVPSLGLGWQWNWKYRDLYEIVFLDLILIYCVCTME